MITKANDTVLDLSDPPRVSQVDMTAGTITTNATAGTEILNWQTMDAALKALIPAGTVVPWAGTTPPSGWLLCDGSGYSSVTYPTLFANIGGTFGANTPDLRGYVVAGVGGFPSVISAAIANTLGGTKGLDEVTLSNGEMPAHDHNANVINGLTVDAGGTHTHTGGVTDFAGTHSHPYGAFYHSSTEGGGGDVEMQPRNTGNAGNHQHTFTVGSGGSSHSHTLGGSITVTLDTEGNDEAHENMQPTMFLNFIIKAH